jgi:hypothetical protein
VSLELQPITFKEAAEFGSRRSWQTKRCPDCGECMQKLADGTRGVTKVYIRWYCEFCGCTEEVKTVPTPGRAS